MQIVKQDCGVVVSLDAYRERRKSVAAARRDEHWEKSEPSRTKQSVEVDEDRGEDTHRLLFMPNIDRPDERELL